MLHGPPISFLIWSLR